MTITDKRPALTSVSDAMENNWVDCFAPQWALGYLRLSRVDRPIGTWLLLIPCWWGMALAMLSADRGQITPYDIWLIVAFAIGAFLMRGAGCTWNDIIDRKFDAMVERTKLRPIPSGMVSVPRAIFWMLLQMAGAGLVLMTFNTYTIILTMSALIFIAIYPFAKRFTWWPQMFLGVVFNWGVLVGWASYSETLSIAPVMFYISAISWTLFYDTIYAHQDKKDDAYIGVKSTARLLAHKTPMWLAGFLTISLCSMILAVIAAIDPVGNLLIISGAIVGVWGFGMHLYWQIMHLNIDDPENCLRIFQSNKIAGLIPLMVFVFLILSRIISLFF